MTPDTLLGLANLTVARKPDRGPTIHPDPLAALPRLHHTQLGALRELHKTVVQLVDGLLSGRSGARPVARLTKLAQPSIARVRLDRGENRTLHARLQWSEPTPAATLARKVVLA